MYSFIKGKIDSKHTECVVIETGGIGYKIYTSLKSLSAMGAAGDDAKLYTHLHVREDAMLLYGFYTSEELICFELLISVSGVGPKAALALLSSHTASKLSLAIISGDYKILKEAPGIGLKTAQRVVLELKDKILKGNNTVDTDIMESLAMANASGEDDDYSPSGDLSVYREAISALVVLGYSQIEARRCVEKSFKDGMSVEDLVKAALVT